MQHGTTGRPSELTPPDRVAGNGSPSLMRNLETWENRVVGMIVQVYRSNTGEHDCTAGGMTNHKTGVDQLCLINVAGPFMPTEDTPAALLAPGPLGSLRIVPACPRWEFGGCRMFGGNFAYTSDSRFTNAVREMTNSDHAGPVAIHDRFER